MRGGPGKKGKKKSEKYQRNIRNREFVVDGGDRSGYNDGSVFLSLYIEKQEANMQKTGRKETWAALYARLSMDDGNVGESMSIQSQELLCKGWFQPPNTYDCGSFVVN